LLPLCQKTWLDLFDRVPLVLLRKAEDVFAVRPLPAAFLVDVEGTVTQWHPTSDALLEALFHFDVAARRAGVDSRQIFYWSNAPLELADKGNGGLERRWRSNAHKPFCTPPEAFKKHGHSTVVVGDQYLTDGLLAWRYGFSFALVSAPQVRPLWPRLQLAIGSLIAGLFFRHANGKV
jgi:hypothetical protein